MENHMVTFRSELNQIGSQLDRLSRLDVDQLNNTMDRLPKVEESNLSGPSFRGRNITLNVLNTDPRESSNRRSTSRIRSFREWQGEDRRSKSYRVYKFCSTRPRITPMKNRVANI